MDGFNIDEARPKRGTSKMKIFLTMILSLGLVFGAMWYWLSDDEEQEVIVDTTHLGIQSAPGLDDSEQIIALDPETVTLGDAQQEILSIEDQPQDTIEYTPPPVVEPVVTPPPVVKRTVTPPPVVERTYVSPPPPSVGRVVEPLPPVVLHEDFDLIIPLEPVKEIPIELEVATTKTLPDAERDIPEGTVRRPLNVEMAKSLDASLFVSRQDDSVVSQTFVMGLASWMVDAYTPSKKNVQKGKTVASLQMANLRFGHSMHGITYMGDDKTIGRRLAIQYFFTPDMLQALYQLYNKLFFATLEHAADVKKLTTNQKKEMYALYARHFRGLSGVFKRFTTLPDLSERLLAFYETQGIVVELNKDYTTALFSLDEAKERKHPTDVARAKKEIGVTSALYQEALIHQGRMLEHLVSILRQNAGARLLDDSTLLYAASWADRRYQQAIGPDHSKIITAAMGRSSEIFLNIAKHFEQLAQ